MRQPQPSDLRVGELLMLTRVHQHGSLSAAARALKTTPSHVSRTLDKLERNLGVPLLVRNSKGARLTRAGTRLIPLVDSFNDELRGLRRDDSARELSVATPSFLGELLVPALVELSPPIRLSSLQLPTALLRAFAGEGLFDVALMEGHEQLPALWSRHALGRLRHGLFAPPALAASLGRAPVAERALRDIAFVTPIYFSGSHRVPGEDRCPLAVPERRLGHEAQTFTMALALAARGAQLVFGPVSVARPWLRSGELTEVAVKGWNVQTEISLSCIDTLPARLVRATVQACREAVAAAWKEDAT